MAHEAYLTFRPKRIGCANAPFPSEGIALAEEAKAMTNVDAAKLIAEKANECCHRSDGFEKIVYDLALGLLQDAWRRGFKSSTDNPQQPESMGR